MSSIAEDYAQGFGGLRFVAKAPPGIGRLIRIPFYMTNAAQGFDACVAGGSLQTGGAANGTASSVSPVIIASATNAIGLGNSVKLQTPQVSWAELRVVGFEISINDPLIPTAVDTEVVVQDLKLGGGINLFTHEDYAPARIYLAGSGEFSGLRDYPLLKSPNQAEVSVAVFTAVAAATATFAQTGAGLQTAKLFSCNLVCEILKDDNYGSHMPGPYARSKAMVRRL